MKFVCPKCKHPGSVFRNACPECGFPLTVGAALAYYGQRSRERLGLSCTRCHQPVPFPAKVCAHCQTPLTVENALSSTLTPLRQRWRRFLRGLQPHKRRIQWCYLFLSAAVLWWLLAYVETHHAGSWFKHAALSSVYLAVFAFLASWLGPHHLFWAVSQQAGRLMKFALVLNFLASLLVLQLLIGVWWARALILAGLFLVMWVAGKLLFIHILPMASQTSDLFLGTGATDIDYTTEQGRKARLD